MRRLGAILYDTLLLGGVVFAATLVALPFNGGSAFTAGQYGFSIYLLSVSFIFFGWFWTHGGQTLGMQTWKIRIYSDTGAPLTWKQSLVRFLASILSWATLGMGFLWVIASPTKRAWHDLLSGTRIDWADAKRQ